MQRTMLLGVGTLLVAGSASAQSIMVSTGIEFTSGNYGGSEKTDVLYAPISLGINTGDWGFRASIPYLNISGPGLFLGEDIPVVRSRDAINRGSNDDDISGFGDVSVQVSKTTQLDANGNWELDLVGRVKLPTSDDADGLGTGETDLSFSADVIHHVGAWSYFVGGGYRWNGQPDDRVVDDIAFASVGAIRYTDTGSSWGIAYDFSQSATDDTVALEAVDDSHEVSTWVGFDVTETARVQLYALSSLSDGGPDYGAGARLSFSY